MIFKGSVLVMKRKDLMRGGSKKSIRPTIGDKTPNLSPTLRKSEKVGAFSFDLGALLNPNGVITEAQASELYPEHVVLNTLKTPSYFGEIALSQLTARYSSNKFLDLNPKLRLGQHPYWRERHAILLL